MGGPGTRLCEAVHRLQGSLMLHRIDSSTPSRCLLADTRHIGAVNAIALRGVTMVILHRAVVDLRTSNPRIYRGRAGHSVLG